MILKYWQRNQLWESFRVESLSGFLWETIFFFPNMTLFCLHLQSGIFLVTTVYKRKKNVKKIKVLQFWPTCEFCSHLVRLMDNGERKSESSTKPRSVWNFSKLLLKVLAAILGAGCQRVEVMPLGWTWNNWNPHETWRTPRWAPCHFSLAIPVSPVLFLWPHTSDFQHFFFFFFKSDMSLRRRSAIFIPGIDLNFFFFL